MEGVPSVLDLLDLEYVEENLYRSCAVVDGPNRLYGGQVAAQALYAAGRTVPATRLPHSMHGYFLREGSAQRPTVFQVERDRDGRSFSARRVVAIQDGQVIFNVSASFAAPRPGADEDAAGPDVPAADALPARRLPGHASFEVAAAEGEPQWPGRFWVRCTAGLRDDPLLHAAVLAYASDLPAGARAREGEDARTGVSLDHAVWFHRPALMDGWTWHERVPQAVSGGRGWYAGAVFAADGARVATVAQEVLFKGRR